MCAAIFCIVLCPKIFQSLGKNYLITCEMSSDTRANESTAFVITYLLTYLLTYSMEQSPS